MDINHTSKKTLDIEEKSVENDEYSKYGETFEEALNALTTERTEQIVASLFAKYGPIRHQFESFEKFMRHSLPQMIEKDSALSLDMPDNHPWPSRHCVTFANVTVSPPSFKENNGQKRIIFPYECRLRKLTYTSSVYADLTHRVYDISDVQNPKLTSTLIYREVLMVQIPIMVKSSFCNTRNTVSLANECPLDIGGYFIINGSEKVIISQERARNNFPYVFPVKQPNKYEFVCETRSLHEKKVRSTSTLYAYITRHGTTPEVFVEIPFAETFHIPLVVIFKILGLQNQTKITNAICKGKEFVGQSHPNQGLTNKSEKIDVEMKKLVDSLVENHLLYTTRSNDDLFEWIGREVSHEPTRERRINAMDRLCMNEILPHLGMDKTLATRTRKIVFLGRMIRKLCKVYLKRIEVDDRDDLTYKRIDTTGPLMLQLFRPFFQTVRKYMLGKIRKNVDEGKPINISDAANPKKTTACFKYAMSTGNWGVQKGGSTNKGVAQVHSRMTHTATLSNLRRVNTHINKEGKMPKPRQLHDSHWGYYCGVETPESSACGILKSLAIYAGIRTGSDPQPILDVIRTVGSIHDFMEAPEEIVNHGSEIYLNGVIVGYSLDPKGTVIELRQKRFEQAIPYDTTISYDDVVEDCIQIHCDGGCLIRPAWVVDKLYKFGEIYHSYYNAPLLLWDIMMREGLIEFFDNEEQRSYNIAVYPDDLIYKNDPEKPYTHLEIMTTMIFGACASTIPHPDRSQAPRLIYQVSMGKQASAPFCLNTRHRVDTMNQYLMYPQTPLVQTVYERFLNLTKLPIGQNVTLAVMTYTGFNQEDSLILNKSSVDRGMFRALIERTVKEELKTRGTDNTLFENPKLVEKENPDGDGEKIICKGIKEANYDKIQQDGLPLPGTKLVHGDVIIGKTMTSVNPQYGEGDKKVSRFIKRDNSMIMKHDEEAVVTKLVVTKNRDGFDAVNVATRAMLVPDIGDKFCLDPSHDVLTDCGWVNITQITNQQRVATLRDGGVFYETPSEIISFHHEGEMWMVENDKLSLFATPQHRMWTTKGFIMACDMQSFIEENGQIVMLQNARRGVCDSPTIQFFDVKTFIDSLESNNPRLTVHHFLWLLGQSWSLAKEGFLESIFWQLVWLFLGIEVKNFLYNIKESGELPEWITRLTTRESESFLKGVFDGGRRILVDVNTKTCDMLQIVGLHGAIEIEIVKQSQTLNQETHNVICHGGDLIDLRGHPVKLQDLYRHKYEGSVHCVTVTSGIFYVRRNGKACWTGNSSRHGQKGTNGMMYSQEDLPFSAITGQTPDVILNPHAVPSRMTIGKLVEMIQAKAAAFSGKIADGTPYRDLTVKDIESELIKHGFKSNGYESMYCGQTGKLIKAQIFFCPCYYQVLKHRTVHKYHSRARGPLNILVRQPTEGRQKGGGLKVGEMERDAMIAYGAANVILDRLMLSSDPYQTVVCGNCGLFAEPKRPDGQGPYLVRASKNYCRNCDSYDDIHTVRIPYACKLLIQELGAMHIALRLNISKDVLDDDGKPVLETNELITVGKDSDQ